MGTVFTPLDAGVFFAALTLVMVIGLLASRRDKTAEAYFLAGRNVPWWGVAGSIYGSNVSANHMIGMMGIGFSVGFAQSHFELGAIAGLMLLCYGFLPVYRRLRIYTLSEYLERRYDQRSRAAYAIILVITMAVVQLVPALYIGARSSCVLMGGAALEEIGPESIPGELGDAEAGSAGSSGAPAKSKLGVNRFHYSVFVLILAAIATSYTIFGGLKAVIWTDVIQSVLLLLGGVLLAILTFDRLGGWSALMDLDRAGAGKMHLYLPSDHPDLPWTGVLTGLMALHIFYWGTNQFIVQRALSARSDAQARLGIVAAGFLKLLIPFFSIAGGVAAFYLFQSELPNRSVAPDTAFTELIVLVIKPLGFGLIGLIAAGAVGAILSSIDSMMNSAATIVSMDLYRRYLNPQASDAQMIRVGRWSILGFVTLASLFALFVIDPNSEKNFFLQIVDYQGYLTPGLLVVFLLGLFWRRTTPTAAFATIVLGVFYSWAVEWIYVGYLAPLPAVAAVTGEALNFFHRVVMVVVLCTLTAVLVSRWGSCPEEKAKLTWAGVLAISPGAVRNLLAGLVVWLGVMAALAAAVAGGGLTPAAAALPGSFLTLGMFWMLLRRRARDRGHVNLLSWAVREDRCWAGCLCAAAVFFLFYFY